VDQAGGGRSFASCPCGHVEAPDLLENGGRSGDRDPSYQARAIRPVTQNVYNKITDNLAPLGLDTLAGGTPVCMYRQTPLGPLGGGKIPQVGPYPVLRRVDSLVGWC
jgi:hypothetical protein